MSDDGRTVLVRVHSHRARRKLRDALGEGLGREWFSFYRPGEFYRLTPEQATTAVAIVGVTRARYTHNLRPCIDAGPLGVTPCD